jgi:hypothetical protein
MCKLNNAEPSLIWWQVCSVSEQLLAIDHLSTSLPVKFSSRRLGASHLYSISNQGLVDETQHVALAI